MKILINSLGIQDSGGITVLKKAINEIKYNKEYTFFIFLFENINTIKLYDEFHHYSNLKFKFIKNRGIIHRILFENLYFIYFSEKNDIDLVYNFSGTAQFLSNTRQLVKVHNLLFYSKKLDEVYFQKKNYYSWVKNIFIKRKLLKLMLMMSSNIEIQSNHVKSNLEDYMDISKKNFFLKNDFNVVNSFKRIKEYDFTKKIIFLYIVGPHFYMQHKNITDFIQVISKLNKDNLNFEIKITLSKKELENSGLWNSELNARTIFLGYISKDEIEKLFLNNTILISTSIIETLGLHVVESISNGILTIVPNENYSKSIYGKDILDYNLFDFTSLIQTIKNITLCSNSEVNTIITKNQEYLIKNENIKHKSVINIFNKILKAY